MKKGYTLLELIISIGLIAVITALEFNIMTQYYGSFKKNTQKGRSEVYVNEAFLFIDKKLKDCSTVRIEDEALEIYSIEYKNHKETAMMYKFYISNGIIKIKYYEEGIQKGENNLLKNVESFVLHKANKLLYITIRDKNGEVYKRCFAVQIE